MLPSLRGDPGGSTDEDIEQEAADPSDLASMDWDEPARVSREQVIFRAGPAPAFESLPEADLDDAADGAMYRIDLGLDTAAGSEDLEDGADDSYEEEEHDEEAEEDEAADYDDEDVDDEELDEEEEESELADEEDETASRYSRMSRPPAPKLNFGSIPPEAELERVLARLEPEDEEDWDEGEEDDSEAPEEEVDSVDRSSYFADLPKGYVDEAVARVREGEDEDEELDSEPPESDAVDEEVDSKVESEPSESDAYDDDEDPQDSEAYDDAEDDEDEEGESDRVQPAPFDEATLNSEGTSLEDADSADSSGKRVTVQVEMARQLEDVDREPVSRPPESRTTAWRRNGEERKARSQKMVGIVVGVVALVAFGLAIKAKIQPKPEHAERHQATAAAVTAKAVSDAQKKAAAKAADEAKTAQPGQEDPSTDEATDDPSTDEANGDPSELDDWDKVKDETLRLLRAGEFAKAEPWARRLIELRPKHAFGYRCLGASLKDQQKFIEEREAYNQCVTHATKGDRAECMSLGGIKRD